MVAGRDGCVPGAALAWSGRRRAVAERAVSRPDGNGPVGPGVEGGGGESSPVGGVSDIMSLTVEKKLELLGSFRTHERDTGSPEVQ